VIIRRLDRLSRVSLRDRDHRSSRSIITRDNAHLLREQAQALDELAAILIEHEAIDGDRFERLLRGNPRAMAACER
jgi:hypothetical protein